VHFFIGREVVNVMCKQNKRIYLFGLVVTILTTVPTMSVFADGSQTNLGQKQSAERIHKGEIRILYVAKETLEVRVTPDLNAIILDNVKSDSELLVLDGSESKKDGIIWVRIFYGNYFLKTGWVPVNSLTRKEILPTTSGQPKSSYGKILYECNANAVNIRGDGCLSGGIQGVLNKGDQVKVLYGSEIFKDGYKWLMVYYGDRYGNIGWVAATYLTQIEM